MTASVAPRGGTHPALGRTTVQVSELWGGGWTAVAGRCACADNDAEQRSHREAVYRGVVALFALPTNLGMTSCFFGRSGSTTSRRTLRRVGTH